VFRILMTVAAIDGIGFGLAALVVPELTISVFGGELNALGLALFRQLGGIIIGYGLIDWFVRNLEPGPMRRGLAIGNLVTFSAIAITASIIASGGLLNALGWGIAAIHAFVSLGLIAVLVTSMGTEPIGSQVRNH
jgi:hypothetical protein